MFVITESKTVNLVTTDENGKEVLEKGNAMKNAGGARFPGYLSNIELSSGEGT